MSPTEEKLPNFQIWNTWKLFFDQVHKQGPEGSNSQIEFKGNFK